ncbi:MAG: ATP synthase F1 subunit gamma [Bacteroidales bacterium]
MPNLKEIRTRINSIRSTRQITSAMKMVAASKLHKSQQLIQPLRHYVEQFKDLMESVFDQFPPGLDSPFLRQSGAGDALIISVSSNKGLCGTYNTQVHKKTTAHIRALEEAGYRVKIYQVGKKTERFFRKHPIGVFATDHEIIDQISAERASAFARQIMHDFKEGKYERVDVVYNQFINAVSQELVAEQVLPLPLGTLEGMGGNGTTAGSVGGRWTKAEEPFGYILEPTPEEVAKVLIPKFITTNFYRIFLDASASEHGARMTSMHKATDNADELLHSLTLTYNKARQAMITREIMEIVGGAEVFRQ